MTTVIDYSTGPPSAAEIKAAGHVGAVRYLRKKGSSNVVTLTAAEVLDFQAHGLLLALTYEDPAKDWMAGGRDIGIDRAKWALEQARAVGIEHPRCIYLCHDAHATAGQVALVMECLDGARTVLAAATGIYGFPEVVGAAMAGGHADRFWQCGRRGDVLPGTHLYQRNNEQIAVAGITCDIDDVLEPDWGQHDLSGEDPEEINMKIIDCPNKPALLLAGTVQALTNAQRDALRGVGVPAQRVDAEAHAALFSLAKAHSG